MRTAEAKDETWVARLATFAVSRVESAMTPPTFFKLAQQILLSMAESVSLQKAVFQKLWKSRQLQQFTPGAIIGVIMQAFEKDALVDEACRAFCLLQLRVSLRQMQRGKDGRAMADTWQQWLNQADQHEDSLYVEVILRFVMQCARDSTSDDDTLDACPELTRLQDAWGVAADKEQTVGTLRVSLLLQNPDFWNSAMGVSRKRASSLSPQVMQPLLKSLESLSQKIVVEDLTVREVFNTAASLEAWENPVLVGLLEERSSIALGQSLQKIIKKLRFMQEFEVNVRRHLLVVFQGQGRARDFAKMLYESFLKASIAGDYKLSDVPNLSVKLAQINEDAWQLPVTLPPEQQRTLDNTPDPTFCSVLKAIKTLHLARSERNRPLQRMFQEIEQEMKRAGDKLNLLDTILFLYNGIEQMLNELSGFAAEDAQAGIPSQILSSIERHWAGIAPQQVPHLLKEINSVTSLLRGDLDEIGRRLEAVLQGRQTVDFWNLCNRILTSLSSCISNRPIGEVFSEETKCHIASLQTMHKAFEAAVAQKETKLTTADLDNVMAATQRIRGLLEAFGAGGSGGFDSVLRLVTTMAEVPGLSFLKILLSSAQKGEHLAMRLTELVEGALTQETLTNVEQASAVFMPLCVAALASMNTAVDPNKFSPMVESEWSREIQRSALEARSKGDIGGLMLSMLQEAHRKRDKNGAKLADFFEGLRSALRQGQVVQQKLEENSDDATAVSNTVTWMPVRVSFCAFFCIFCQAKSNHQPR